MCQFKKRTFFKDIIVNSSIIKFKTIPDCHLNPLNLFENRLRNISFLILTTYPNTIYQTFRPILVFENI